jgi:excisionase family DNA binding protein
VEKFLTVQEAAAYRGVTIPTIRNWTRAGRLAQHQGKRGTMISRAELEKITNADALAVLAAYGSQENLAVKVRDLLFPVDRVEVQKPGQMVVFKSVRSANGEVAARQLRDPMNGALVADAVTVFGRPTLEAACIPDGVGCRWHFADMLAITHGGPMPVDLPAWRTLLGQPCVGCVLRLNPRGPKRQTVARKPPGRRSPGLSAGGGPGTPVYWRSQADNALKLADQARARGDHAESRRLRDRAAEHARKAGN